MGSDPDGTTFEIQSIQLSCQMLRRFFAAAVSTLPAGPAPPKSVDLDGRDLHGRSGEDLDRITGSTGFLDRRERANHPRSRISDYPVHSLRGPPGAGSN